MKKRTNFMFLILICILLLELIILQSTAEPGYPKRLPRVVVFNGNDAYHTSIEGFIANASTWGYEVISVDYLNNASLTNAEILVLNAPDFLTEDDKNIVETWWGLGGKSIWFVGESDYAGQWNPADLNELAVDLGSDIIIVDDAISDTTSPDGASYRVIANTTNSDPTWDNVLRLWSPVVTNVSLHGSTYLTPWTGDNTGSLANNPGAQAKWTDLANADWIVNSSKYATVQDQDFDDDDVWEGAAPLSTGSFAMVAAQWGLAGGNKMIFSGESIFSDYKNMFGYETYYTGLSIQNINLTRGLLEWAFDPATELDIDIADDTKNPIVTVFSGNGAYHTAIEGFKANATTWGYTVLSLNSLTYGSLIFTDILILNAPDYLTDSDKEVITDWWNTGNRTIWFVGESDYGGYWNPADLNELAVDLGSNIIIVDDAISDPVSQDGASYRVIANTTNSDPTWDNVLRQWSPEITNITMHGPTYVAPWTGDNTGNVTSNPGAQVTWASLPNADWIVNSSKYATVKDQDFDDGDVWEGVAPLSTGSFAMVATQWNVGPWINSKVIFSGESIFADYKDMFGHTARYAGCTIQNINLTRGLLEWAFYPSNAPAKTRPMVYVWSGNGAYHTSVEGLIKNATRWGFNVYASTFWVDIILEMSNILIVNAPDFLTDYDMWVIKYWWNTGNRTIWFVGESDYAGQWNPADLNELAVDLGSNVIIVDDAISDSISHDGASYRVIANITNSDPTWDNVLRQWGPDVTNISIHTPSYVAPWTGDNTGSLANNPGAQAKWTDLANADWIVNSSKYATVKDQDFDNDDVWEGASPLSTGSFAMVATQWNVGPWSESKMIFSGESIFSDYKDMFGYETYYTGLSIQNINLTRGLLEWGTPSNISHYQIADDMYALRIEVTGNNTHLVGGADYLYDNEVFNISFLIHDFPNAYSGLKDLYVTYDDGASERITTVTQTGFNSFYAVFEPFPAETDVSYYIYVEDQAGWKTISDSRSFSVDYSDTMGPEIDAYLSQTTDIYPDTVVSITATVIDIADEDEIISGLSEVIIEYSTNGGSTWNALTLTVDISTYSAVLPPFAVGTTVQIRVTATDAAGNLEIQDILPFTIIERTSTTSTTTIISDSTETSSDTRTQPKITINTSPLILSPYLLLTVLVVITRRRHKKS
ncbi:MAG: hypothetical protein ACTSW1_09305 [Candidatus Hodarchaeales archaeon]